MGKQPAIVVPGGLNTDIILSGVGRLLASGELGSGEKLSIMPGGKSRNIAQMLCTLTGPGTVAMIGRTCRDRFGLWEVPYRALRESGVNVDHVHVADTPTDGMPGIALIPVDRDGHNQIYLYAGENAAFSPEDIDAAAPLFAGAGSQGGILALSLEMPMSTAMQAIRHAKQSGMRVVLDPGGISPQPTEEQLREYHRLLSLGIDIIKPNEHEAAILTSAPVHDLSGAQSAAAVFRRMGIPAALITAGASGAYLIADGASRHLPVPKIETGSSVRDETGCGDQAMAALCAELFLGSSVERAAEVSVLAGALQFRRLGVQPIAGAELAGWKARLSL